MIISIYLTGGFPIKIYITALSMVCILDIILYLYYDRKKGEQYAKKHVIYIVAHVIMWIIGIALGYFIMWV